MLIHQTPHLTTLIKNYFCDRHFLGKSSLVNDFPNSLILPQPLPQSQEVGTHFPIQRWENWGFKQLSDFLWIW